MTHTAQSFTRESSPRKRMFVISEFLRKYTETRIIRCHIFFRNSGKISIKILLPDCCLSACLLSVRMSFVRLMSACLSVYLLSVWTVFMLFYMWACHPLVDVVEVDTILDFLWLAVFQICYLPCVSRIDIYLPNACLSIESTQHGPQLPVYVSPIPPYSKVCDESWMSILCLYPFIPL